MMLPACAESKPITLFKNVFAHPIASHQADNLAFRDV
jgi:hypothetical protein